MELESKGTIVVIPDLNQPTEHETAPVSIPLGETGTPPPTAAPNKPKNLTVNTMQDGILLSWHEPDGTTASNRVLGYHIYRKKGNEKDSLFVRNSVNDRVFLDQTTTPGQTTSYYVTAWNGIGESPISNRCTTTGIGYPPQVVDFKAIAVSSNSVLLNWKVNGDNVYVDEFVLKRKKKIGAEFEDYKTFPATAREYIDNTGLNVFDTAFYQMHIRVNHNLSEGVQDFVFMPERNPATSSPVRLHALRFDGNLKGYWEWSYPSFCIKVVNVDRKDNNKTKIVVNQIYFDGPMVGMGLGYATNLVFYMCDKHLFNWTVDDWYDSVTFYIQKTKGSNE